jgi:large subunit ribosomal protein L9
MEIILKEDVKGLGYKDDIVDVRPGYAQNYLIPQGFALAASSSNRKVRDENIRQASHKAAKMKQDAEQLAENIGEMKLTLSTKAGESGKIFGAITPLQIADLLTEKGYNIERKKISLPNSVKELGEYDVVLDLHKEVKHTIKVDVVAE